MHKNKILSALLLSGVLLLTGCGSSAEPAVYSSLSETSVRYDLDSLLQRAGVSDQQRFVLFAHVDQINEVLGPGRLTEGFTSAEQVKYDPWELQEEWTEAYPDFLGYNCRITSFSLFGDGFLSFPEKPVPGTGELLEFDAAALAEDPSAFPGQEENFLSFYEPVPTENTKDVKVHAENMLQAWKTRGISFRDDPDIRMINMVFHWQDGDRNLLFVGHTGILLPTPDGDLWFLEKLAFQEPYRVVRLESRKQLASYLMGKYDLDQGQPMAEPFILENDSMMKI